MTAYADSSDMIARYSSTVLGDLVVDDGERAEEVDLPTNNKMTVALSTATGHVNAACLRANRYTVADLESLTGESAEYLNDIVCAQAFWLLWRRKPYQNDDLRKVAKEEADKALEAIRNGDLIFDLDATKDAGIPDIDTVSRIDITTNWELAIDRNRSRHSPRRRSFGNR